MEHLSGIEIRVREEDGIAYAADVLVLKHAQAVYGLDSQVVERIGAQPDALPAPDGYRVFHPRKGVGAKVVIFIGVPPIREFSYRDIRRFGYKALCSVASASPQATEIALTLHGVGYGLDEVECFDAEVAGILDAIESDDVPRSLRRVTFLEINPGRAARMQERLPRLLGSQGIASATSSRAHVGEFADRLREAGKSDNKRAHAFVAMPFDDSFTDVFHYGISSAVRASGLLCERIDRKTFTGDILERMKDEIRTAALVVADLTGANPNVSLEVGFAWGSGVPTVLVCHEGSSLKFDVQGQRCLFYKSIKDLEEKLGLELSQLGLATAT